MTDTEFLDDLERRARDKSKPFFVTSEERTRIGLIECSFTLTMSGTTKRALVLAEITFARNRIINQIKDRVVA